MEELLKVSELVSRQMRVLAPMFKSGTAFLLPSHMAYKKITQSTVERVKAEAPQQSQANSMGIDHTAPASRHCALSSSLGYPPTVLWSYIYACYTKTSDCLRELSMC